jgi:hypothetical protein
MVVVAGKLAGKWNLSPRFFHLPTTLLQQTEQQVAVIALDLDKAVFDGSAGAAALFELFGQLLELARFQLQAGDQGDSFAFTTLGFTLNADNSITFASRCRRSAPAILLWLAAARAQSAELVAIRGSAVVVHGNKNLITTDGA